MPKRSYFNETRRENISKRWRGNDENNNIIFDENVNDSENTNFTSLNELNRSLDENIHVENSCQTELFQKDQSTQTDGFESSFYLTNVQKFLKLSNLADLVCIFIDSIKAFSSIYLRILSTIIYLLLRLISLKFNDIRLILSDLNLVRNLEI